jgi:outer membrane protein insertion porin family
VALPSLRRLVGVGSLVVALAVSVSGGGAQEPPLNDQPELVDVVFDGNRAFPDDSLASAIEHRETTCRLPFGLCPPGLGFLLDRRYLAPRTIPQDSLRLLVYYHFRGYREVQVDTALTPLEDDHGVRLTFTIEEGRPVLIDSLGFLGVEDVEADVDLLSRLPVRRGSPLNNLLLEATRDTIVGRLRDVGYPRAYVLKNQFIPAGSHEAMVEFDIVPGPWARFGEITIQRSGDETVLSDQSLRRMLPFREGDRYSRQLIYEAQRNLFGLDIVRNASIQEDLEAEPDTLVPLTVQVAEGDGHRVRVGAGWSTSDCLNAESTWASRNFFGGARRLQVRARLSNLLAKDLNQNVLCEDSGTGAYAQNNWLTEVELFQPWFFSTRNSLTLSVFWERQSLPDVFVRRAGGVTATLGRRLGPATTMTVSYRPQLTTLFAAEIFFCTSFLVCTPDDIAVLQSKNWLSPLGLSLSRNRTNDLLNPSDGYALLLDLEHASTFTGSDFAYNRLIAEGNWYHEMAFRTVWAARARVGWVAGGEFGDLSLGGLDVIHPQKRFYAGGANSVRGFPQNRLGPRVLTADLPDLVSYRMEEGQIRSPVCQPTEVADHTCDANALDDGYFLPRPQGGTRLFEATLEYRFSFGGQFQAALFTDMGQAWAEGQTVRLSDIELSPGLGVRYFSPIGPIRVDVGYRFRGVEDLQVVTSQLRPFQEGDAEGDKLTVLGENLEQTTIDWVRLDDLALLDHRIQYGGDRSFFRNLQLHFSIGQAF